MATQYASITIQSGPSAASITLNRTKTSPATIVNAPAVSVVLNRQTGESVAAPTSTTDLAALYALAAN